MHRVASGEGALSGQAGTERGGQSGWKDVKREAMEEKWEQVRVRGCVRAIFASWMQGSRWLFLKGVWPGGVEWAGPDC